MAVRIGEARVGAWCTKLRRRKGPPPQGLLLAPVVGDARGRARTHCPLAGEGRLRLAHGISTTRWHHALAAEGAGVIVLARVVHQVRPRSRAVRGSHVAHLALVGWVLGAVGVELPADEAPAHGVSVAVLAGKLAGLVRAPALVVALLAVARLVLREVHVEARLVLAADAPRVVAVGLRHAVVVHGACVGVVTGSERSLDHAREPQGIPIRASIAVKVPRP